MRWFGKKRIYMDYASAPPVLPEATRAMCDAERLLGNPGAIHTEGVLAKRSLEDARAKIALHLGCKAREIVFTSGLTESNNIAILGFARGLERKRRSLQGTHWIVSSIEHDSVLHCFAEVERLGGAVTHLNPNHKGIFTPEVLAEALRTETVCVSIGWANNEIGVLQPLGKLARRIRDHELAHSTTIVFHSDAGQAPLYRETMISSLGVDLLSLGANKLYGPHGVGALFVNETEVTRIFEGGSQERGMRPGTENVALAQGFAAALEAIAGKRTVESRRLKKLRDDFARMLIESIPDIIVNGDLREALPHMLNVSIPNISSEYIALSLDHAGIAVSTKSACREGEDSESHVVAALGGEAWRAKNTLRFSLGQETTSRDTREVVQALAKAVHSGQAFAE